MEEHEKCSKCSFSDWELIPWLAVALTAFFVFIVMVSPKTTNPRQPARSCTVARGYACVPPGAGGADGQRPPLTK